MNTTVMDIQKQRVNSLRNILKKQSNSTLILLIGDFNFTEKSYYIDKNMN